MTIQIENNELVIRIPIQKQPSKSGKTILVASTHGGIKTDQLIDGKPVTVSVNAYILAAERVNTAKYKYTPDTAARLDRWRERLQQEGLSTSSYSDAQLWDVLESCRDVADQDEFEEVCRIIRSRVGAANKPFTDREWKAVKATLAVNRF